MPRRKSRLSAAQWVVIFVTTPSANRHMKRRRSHALFNPLKLFLVCLSLSGRLGACDSFLRRHRLVSLGHQKLMRARFGQHSLECNARNDEFAPETEYRQFAAPSGLV
jgi:hypothetical protein